MALDQTEPTHGVALGDEFGDGGVDRARARSSRSRPSTMR
jgi:hypothetical protein